jgi:uncharacterized protein (TIGR02147 family)
MEKPIYSYFDFRQFLADYHASRKLINPAFSIRAFLKKAGISSPSFFGQILSGDRNLTEKSMEKFLMSMELSDREKEYFRALTRFNQAKSSSEKQTHYQKMRELGDSVQATVVGSELYDYYKDWYTSAIRELVCMVDFNENYALLAKCLIPEISLTEAKKTVYLLERLQMIKKDHTTGRYELTQKLISTGDEVSSMAIRNFNRQMVVLAGESLERFPVDKRHISGITLGISKNTYQEIEQEIKTFQSRILKLIDQDTAPPQGVYQISTMLFPLAQLPEPLKDQPDNLA